jgi:Uma2 family endonuclease
MSEAACQWVSPEEYLALEEGAEHKSEYFHGEIFAMSGATFEHNTISANLVGELRSQLRGSSCRALPSDQRVKVRETGLYTYPDVVVVCGEPEFDGPGRNNLLNPTVIFEVLSPSTEAYDRGEKFQQYRRLPSLREYILVSAEKPGVERFVRHDDRDEWTLTSCYDPDGAIGLTAIGCTLELREIYLGVGFPEAPAGSRRRRISRHGDD